MCYRDPSDLMVAVCACGWGEAREEYSELQRETRKLERIPVSHQEKVTSKPAGHERGGSDSHTLS